MGLSVTLDTAMRALLAQQQAVDVVAHNVSNVTTLGYTRQRVRMQAIPGAYIATGSAVPGAGVEIVSIERLRDMFSNFHIRNASHAFGRYMAQAQSLQRVEIAFGEPSDAGLRAAMSQFWNNWRDLANAPDSAAARNAVIQNGQTLAFVARRIHTSLTALRNEANARVGQDINEINALTEQIATLNGQIVSVSAGPNEGSDLRDQRDLALDRLSTLIDIDYIEDDTGGINVSINGRSLVSRTTAQEIYGAPDILNNNYVELRFVTDDAAVDVRDGEVQGLIYQRDTDLEGRIADLDTLIGTIITDVNAAHSAGYGLDGVTGRNFFSGTDASDIAVDAALLADTNILAAATAGDPSDPTVTPPGDGSNASTISDLQYARGLVAGTATYDEFYEGVIGSIGVATREAEGKVQSQGFMLEHLEQLRQSESGVNLDEEMVQLVRYQRAYEAAARLVAVADEMLDTLINRMAL